MRVVDRSNVLTKALEAAKREASRLWRRAFCSSANLRDPRSHRVPNPCRRARHDAALWRTRVLDSTAPSKDLLKEAPSVALTPNLRAEMGAAAVARGRIGSAMSMPALLSFMLDSTAGVFTSRNERASAGRAPVTELVYGIDLVQWQLPLLPANRLGPRRTRIRRAAGRSKPVSTLKIRRTICSRRPGRSPYWSPPEGPGIRIDAGVTTGKRSGHYYDPMLAKLDSLRPAIAALRSRGLNEHCSISASTACARTCRSCSGSRATTRSAPAKRRRVFSISVSTIVLFGRGRAHAKRSCSVPRRCSSTVARPGASVRSGVPLRLQHGGSVVEIVADALGAPGGMALSGYVFRRTPRSTPRRARAGRVRWYGDLRRGNVPGGAVDRPSRRSHRGAFVCVTPSAESADIVTRRRPAHASLPPCREDRQVAVREATRSEEHALLIVLER